MPEVWRKLKSSFCVDPEQIDMSILGGGNCWSTFCMKRQWLPFRMKRRSTMSILGGGGRWLTCQSPIIDPGGRAQNYTAPLCPSEARGCNYIDSRDGGKGRFRGILIGCSLRQGGVDSLVCVSNTLRYFCLSLCFMCSISQSLNYNLTPT